MKAIYNVLPLGLAMMAVATGTLAAPTGAPAETTAATDDKPLGIVFGEKFYARDLEVPAHLAPKPEPGATPAEIAAEKLSFNRQMVADGVWQEAKKAYLKKMGLEPTEAEIDSYVAFLKKMQQKMEQDPEIKKINQENEVGEDPEVERAVASMMVAIWKFNQGVYKQYGGRVAFQQAGLEPVDALKKFLDALRSSGDYEIYDPGLAKGLFKEMDDYFNHKFDFVSEAEAKKYFATPWWLQTPDEDKK